MESVGETQNEKRTYSTNPKLELFTNTNFYCNRFNDTRRTSTYTIHNRPFSIFPYATKDQTPNTKHQNVYILLLSLTFNYVLLSHNRTGLNVPSHLARRFFFLVGNSLLLVLGDAQWFYGYSSDIETNWLRKPFFDSCGYVTKDIYNIWHVHCARQWVAVACCMYIVDSCLIDKSYSYSYFHAMNEFHRTRNIYQSFFSLSFVRLIAVTCSTYSK